MSTRSSEQITSREEIQADVRQWLKNEPPRVDALASMVSLPSFPATVEQNAVLDVVDEIVGDKPAVTRDRWIPEWARVEDLLAPVDAQKLWCPLESRDPRYREILPQLEILVHSHGSSDDLTLMFNGHVDVVPVDDQPWNSLPFTPTVRDGRLIGRGAMDMKAGLVAAAFAFKYLSERWAGAGRVQLAAVPEEETGGNGTLAVLQRGHRPDAAVFAEPTNLQVVHRHIGIQAFNIDVEGRAGGMLRKSWGASASPATSRIGVALEALEVARTRQAYLAGGYDDDDLPGFVNYTISAGDWLATRAATGSIKGLMSILPGETQTQAFQALRTAVEEATADSHVPVKVAVWPGAHRGGELSLDSPLVRSFVDPRADSGAPGAATRAGTMVCDAKIMQGGGWAPSIVLGPTGGNLHSADEWVDLQSIELTIQLLVAGALNFFTQGLK